MNLGFLPPNSSQTKCTNESTCVSNCGTGTPTSDTQLYLDFVWEGICDPLECECKNSKCLIAKESGVYDGGMSVPQFGLCLDSLGHMVWELFEIKLHAILWNLNKKIHIEYSLSLLQNKVVCRSGISVPQFETQVDLLGHVVWELLKKYC